MIIADFFASEIVGHCTCKNSAAFGHTAFRHETSVLAKIVGTLCQISATFPPLLPTPPSTMLNYCVVSDLSFANYSNCATVISDLQETILFWGEGLFTASKSYVIERSYEEETLHQW